MSREEIKKKVGYKAAELVENNMLVGLGTGSTAFYFIERLIQRSQQGLKVEVVASSQKSFIQAKQGDLNLLDINKISSLHLTVDGTDQIDPQKRMIKGAGGAHVREKIMASMSQEMLVIIDESKMVKELGKTKVPVEILPFAAKATIHHIEQAGYKGFLRTNIDQSLYITDNQNYLFDIYFPTFISSPEQEHQKLIQIPGVIDTGFFFNLVKRVIIGFFDGQIVIKQ
ncbi:MAG: ribose-5-phosphate isomerase RpiA [Candidatus Rhabdochlamydia sp.]|jgi:ribose 5-phosphate isomerase A|nr:ribose 5-phosphate isomerase [Chlamydiota bacterium]